jgi:hypothetical protein
VFKEYGHKKTGVLEPVTETLVQQSVRLQAWTDKWGPTILNWCVHDPMIGSFDVC